MCLQLAELLASPDGTEARRLFSALRREVHAVDASIKNHTFAVQMFLLCVSQNPGHRSTVSVVNNPHNIRPDSAGLDKFCDAVSTRLKDMVCRSLQKAQADFLRDKLWNAIFETGHTLTGSDLEYLDRTTLSCRAEFIDPALSDLIDPSACLPWSQVLFFFCCHQS